LKLPNRALTDADIIKFAKKLEIPHFRGVFMRNDLPQTGPWKEESAIINLDDKSGPGTHWTAYKKSFSDVSYFDSFGNLSPPSDFISYIGSGSLIKYNHKQYQNWNTYNCRHSCLKFLSGHS
jgi:hypothetical protein